MFTHSDRRLLIAIAEKLELTTEIGLASLKLERIQMAKLDAARALNAQMMEAIRANVNGTEAALMYIGALKADLADVNARLATAIENEATDEEVAALMSEQQEMIDAINADTAAEVIMAGTPAAPTE